MTLDRNNLPIQHKYGLIYKPESHLVVSWYNYGVYQKSYFGWVVDKRNWKLSRKLKTTISCNEDNLVTENEYFYFHWSLEECSNI